MRLPRSHWSAEKCLSASLPPLSRGWAHKVFLRQTVGQSGRFGADQQRFTDGQTSETPPQHEP